MVRVLSVRVVLAVVEQQGREVVVAAGVEREVEDEARASSVPVPDAAVLMERGGRGSSGSGSCSRRR